LSINILSLEEEKDMYGTKEDLGEQEDYFPFILIPLGF
jgi:hypothetical protein